MGYNEVLGQEQYNVPSIKTLYPMGFSRMYDKNCNIMVAVQCAAFLLYLLYRITLAYHVHRTEPGAAHPNNE